MGGEPLGWSWYGFRCIAQGTRPPTANNDPVVVHAGNESCDCCRSLSVDFVNALLLTDHAALSTGTTSSMCA